MVQMKGKRYLPPRDILVLLYIPHGSDESVKSHLNSFLQYLLYIPHGSDERVSNSEMV